MRIWRVSIKNFRCLESIEIDFDDVTTFVGPNGAGKSSVLRALDWFFNGTKQTALTIDDVFQRDVGRKVEVAVEFDGLSAADRERLGRYAAPGQNSIVIRKTWADGAEKIIGRSRVFPPFQDVRSGGSASERKAAYQELRSARPDLDLPSWSNDAAVAQAMAEWESSHSDELEDADVETSTHFFGFAGQGHMAGLFDFIFVSADMRAAEEVADSKSSVIGRILERAVDRTAADTELEELLQSVTRQQEAIQTKHFADQLSALSERLTAEVSSLAAGRALHITSEASPPQPQRMQFRVNVIDRELETSVDRQGHGFQRALLIAALKLLAEHGQGHQPEGVVCLAIEEPELYQHPLQARLFAAVLRSLAEDASRGVQVMYATHSPYFIEAKSFHQIRRVTRTPSDDGNDATQVVGSTIERVISRLDGFVDAERIRRQLDGVCLGALGEGFFSEVVLLVEGSTDRAVLSGVAAREATPLLIEGIYVGEAGGKQGLLLPYVILDELGIPAFVLADNDSHLEAELEAAKSRGDLDRVRKLKDSVADSKAWNRKILRFFGCDEEDWPTGPVALNLTFVDGGLERALADMWPAWSEARDALVEVGAGFSGKDQATYEEAAIHADGEVPELLTAIISGARALRAA